MSQNTKADPAARALSLLAEAHQAARRGCPVQAMQAYRQAVALQRGDAYYVGEVLEVTA